jgi:hypothetical protein
MALRKLAAAAPVIAVLALAGPAGAAAQTTSAPGSPGSMIACYPYPAFCAPNGAPWSQYFQSQLGLPTTPAFGSGAVQLPGTALP